MADTPKPRRLAVVPSSREDTRSFEREGPPTDRIEIPVSGPAREESLLFLLPEKRFARGELIVSENDHFKVFYVIEAGRAEESLVSKGAEADMRPLNPADVIGLTRNARVKAVTDLVVRLIDFEALEETHDRGLLRFANALIREAAIRSSSENREIAIGEQATTNMERAAAEQLNQLLETERKEAGIRLSVKNAENENLAIDNARLARRIKTLERELDHKAKEVASSVTILELYKDELDETGETLERRTAELTKLWQALAELSGLSPVFEQLIASGNPEWARLGQKALTLLFELGKRSNAPS